MVGIASVLLIFHGLEKRPFQVDAISLGLLGFVSLPFLSLIVTSFKAGNVEFSFRDLSVHDQVLTFLDGIAMKRQWTFFRPRQGESELGPAFAELTKELATRAHEDLIRQLRTWLKSDDSNQKWFAAEIVGHHKLAELGRVVLAAPETTDIDITWQPWELNCLWAASRLEVPMYEGLCRFLQKTTSSANQRWILNAFDQMVDLNEAEPRRFDAAIEGFVALLRERKVAEASVDALFEKLTHLPAPPHAPISVKAV